MSDHEDPQFRYWLTARMNAANLSQAERAEFMQWLLKRQESDSKVSKSPSALGSAMKKERLKQLKECFDWLKVRITESDLSESEQHEFDSWLATRARESNFLDDDDE